ncbi:BlaI/MecI/CopY family transcriptional regulator [Puia sp.]|jgi:predicted transcriptional regulator|uniref:BlaI/MecI/CopY family transcriptional regulator n=1 Tax=Puia sp. TaxID=2045100 RepID=UPI002F412791
MNKKKPSVDSNDPAEPTRAQLEILQVLWKNGPSTVRFVNDQLNLQKDSLSYTSTLKLMQIMHEKGMVHRDESSMTHIYSAALEEQRTRGVVLKKFVDTMYEGSVKSLMLELLGNEKTSNKDWDTIKHLLTKLDDEK